MPLPTGAPIHLWRLVTKKSQPRSRKITGICAKVCAPSTTVSVPLSLAGRQSRRAGTTRPVQCDMCVIWRTRVRGVSTAAYAS